jgi:hypothetical protein
MRPGADAQGLTQRRAVAMKKSIGRLLAGAVMVFSVTAPGAVMAAQPPAAEGQFCLDGMETVPIEDDLVPTPISVDGGCMAPEAVISI